LIEKVTSHLDSQLKLIKKILPGLYQCQDPVVYHKLVELKAEQFGEMVIYHQIGVKGFNHSAQQQKLYVFNTDSTRSCNSSKTFVILPQHGLINLEQHNDQVAALDPNDLFQFPASCDLMWTADERSIYAQVSGEQCLYPSEAFGGNVRPEMCYEVNDRSFSLNESLYQESGELITSTNGTLVAERLRN